MKKEFIEMHNRELRDYQHYLLRTFVINLVLIAIVWLLTFVPGLVFLGVVMTGMSPYTIHFAIMGALGLWGVLSFVLYLAPALSIGAIRRND